MMNTNGSRSKNKNKDCTVHGQARTGHDSLWSHDKVTKSESLDGVREIGSAMGELAKAGFSVPGSLWWILPRLDSASSVSFKCPLPCCAVPCSPFFYSYQPHPSRRKPPCSILSVSAVSEACVHSDRVGNDGSAQKALPEPSVPAWRAAPLEVLCDSSSGNTEPEELWLWGWTCRPRDALLKRS